MSSHQRQQCELKGRACVRTRILALEEEWELRASDAGVTRLILPSRLDEFSSEQGGLRTIALDADGNIDEETWACLGEKERAAAEHLQAAARQIGEYLAGQRLEFTVSLDPEPTSAFAEQVHVAMRAIPYAQRATYAELARLVGAPRAVRAVGTACGKNPLPVLVPCHRVVRSDGTIGSYTGGNNYKLTFLQIEASSGAR